jgi:ubiquinone/menaquinone biosynthesis C-methylase UbiE|tara:strand:+ start:1745 stop:2383 length:639 start_codon:yes stop_codon:yes gene_type:complete
MKSLSEEWDKFFKQHPYGGPWDYNKHTKKLQDDHVVDFIKYYNFEKNLKVLDCGCADGRNSEYLINEEFEVTGIDFSQTVIERTQKRLTKGKFLTGDIRKLDNIESNSFDFLIDAGALHVNFPKDIISIIKEYHRILKPSGKMFIRVFNKDDDTPNPIFPVNESGTMPVFGYSESVFINHIKDCFNVEYKKYDPNYGMHGQGCNYYYLERKD